MAAQLSLVGKDEQPDLLQGVCSDPVHEVFEFWKALMDKPHAQLGPKRKSKIREVLSMGYTVEQVKLAIVGCKYDNWSQGENDRHRKFDDIELICRNEVNIDRFIEIGNEYMAKAKRVEAEKAKDEAAKAAPMPDYVRVKLGALFEKHRRKG